MKFNVVEGYKRKSAINPRLSLPNHAPRLLLYSTRGSASSGRWGGDFPTTSAPPRALSRGLPDNQRLPRALSRGLPDNQRLPRALSRGLPKRETAKSLADGQEMTATTKELAISLWDKGKGRE
jgi:hypothetical protein